MGIFNKVSLQCLASLVLISSVLNLWRGTEGWSYHSSTKTMDWESARHWCRQHYTDMVAIQNKEEISHLNSILPKVKGYYWIGIRKINGSWTWVGTNKTLTKEAENWADKEPNNGKNNEDCVEIYIKREKDEGKWNDESCLKMKTALCYTASCKHDSCVSGQGECVETINSHKCSCFEGFYGERCEHVVKCKPEDIPPQEHASVRCSHPYGNFSYDSQCEYSCVEGYELKGSSTTRCTSTTEWSSKPPTCELVRCPELIKPQKGQMQCLHSLDIFRYQSTCEFMCEEGYTLRDSSSSTLLCGATGHWNDSQPTCEIIKCKPEDITPPDHASVRCSHPHGNFSYDSQCEYSCEEGYELKGSSTTRCTSTTEWSSKPPTCELVRCPELIKPQKGQMQCLHSLDIFSYQATCEFMCEEGYTLRDSSSSTLFCGEMGHWNDSQPTCEIIKCKPEDITPPDHASVHCSHPHENFSYDSQCEYSCEEGYELKGSSMTRCTSTTEWSSKPPTCELVRCPELIKPQKGQMQCLHSLDIFSYQSTCEFMCEEGYTLRDSSSSTLFCGAMGHWNDAQPTCEIIKCKPEDVTSQDHASVHCSHPHENFSYDSQCEYSCEEGYELKGSSMTRCTSTTEWSSKPPTCELIQCPALDIPINGELSCTSSFKYGSKCSFSCAEGFYIQGASEISCTKAAKWSQEPPRCEAVLCPQLSDPVNGHMNCSSEEPTFGTFCIFSCYEGHQLEDHSNKIVMCNYNGSWSGEVAVCQAHPDPSTSLLEATEVTLGVSGAIGVSTLGLVLWILKRLRRKAKNFDPNSTLDIEDPPQSYKNSVDSLI
uniref:E-selectin n=1 Tax=Cyprinus carpio carpio TaxID=630221 RepID=A0A9J8B712_CYPCA